MLEDAFKLSREDFNKKDLKDRKKSEPTMSPVEIVNEEDSFDMKIFPSLYQSLFQTMSGGKGFDTEGLLKCLSTEIKNYEQYERFIVARYMFWKYFSKLKANFYCDSCEIILTENRYVCLECRDHCLCFSCFSKSILDNTNDTETKKPDNSSSAHFYSTTHRAAHRMLLLDHLCNKCGSLIIGKRMHCEQCPDYDLCLMCYRNSSSPKTEDVQEEEHFGEHSKKHSLSIIEPVILVAKPEYITEIQAYLFLHSQTMFSLLSIKLSCLFESSVCFDSLDESNSICLNLNQAKQLHSEVLKIILFMISKISWLRENNSNFVESLKLLVTYNQEHLVGLAASILKINKTSFIKANKDTNICLDNILDTILDPVNKTSDRSLVSLNFLIQFFLKMLLKRNEYYLTETVICMLINILKNLLSDAEPEEADAVVRGLDSEFVDGELTLELILRFIDEEIDKSQMGLVGLFIGLLSELNQKPKWKSKVNNFIAKIFETIINSFSTENDQANTKLFNFMYALNCAPVSTAIGQWLEYNTEKMEGASHTRQSAHEFKTFLLKSLYYDVGSNAYNMWSIQPDSRKLIAFKVLLNSHKLLNYPRCKYLIQI